LNPFRGINPLFTSDRLSFFPVTENHCTERYLAWLDDPEVTRFLEPSGEPNNLVNLRRYVKKINAGTDVFLAIHLKENGLHIGNIKLSEINPTHSTAIFSILIGDKSAWGNGYGNEASEAMVEYAFQKLQIRKLSLGVVKDHATAVRLYEKLGFVVEGVFVKHCFHDGDFRDALYMSLFRDKWISRRS
jgi:ribosomal-protein-alanine N-acetyltransferase